MKKEKSNEKRATSPDRLILKLASGHPVQNGQWIQSQQAGIRSPFLWRVYPSDGAGRAEVFVSLQGQGSGFTIGKGPPGLSPGSGGGAGRDPDNKAGPLTGKAQSKNTLQSNNTILSINKKQNSNFLQLLIFKIMKKQILILVLFVMATFAGVNNSYGQCTPDPLHPAAGVPYEYLVTISGTVGGTTPIYEWFVTKDVDLITAPVKIAAGVDFTVTATDATFSTYNSVASTTGKLGLTWTPAAIASPTPYYLVVKYTETGTTTPSCTTENMKVWMIDPLNTFLLTVVGSDAAGVAANNFICAANVSGALITAGATPSVAYTYGQNIMYYKVTASGAIGTWTPSISLPALGTPAAQGQNYNNAEWSDDAGVSWNTFGLTDGDVDGGTFTSTATDAPVTVAGSDIIVRIRVDNVSYETLAIQSIILGVDGVLPGAVNDIVGGGTCTDAAAFAKTGTFNINPRPTVADNTTNAPNPTDFITKTP